MNCLVRNSDLYNERREQHKYIRVRVTDSVRRIKRQRSPFATVTGVIKKLIYNYSGETYAELEMQNYRRT